MTNNNADNDHDMNRPETSEDSLRGFSPVKVGGNVRRDAWVLYKDGPIPKGVTRGQWMDQNNGVGPTYDQFDRNSYAIHASLTGNEKLQVNGQFGEHDYMPPQVFVQSIKLSASQQQIVDSFDDKTAQNRKAYGFRAAKFRQIAGEIGVPSDIPKFEKKLVGKAQVYETKGGGAQPCTIQYDNQTRAGNNIPNLQIWQGKELLEAVWRTPDGKGNYDGKSLADAKAAAIAEHGKGVEIALKSNTNRTMGTAQLDQYDNGAGASNRWAAQIGEQRQRNTHFSHFTAVVTNEDTSVPSPSFDVGWLLKNLPDNKLATGLLNGAFGENLRVMPGGNGRISVQFAMKNFPEVTGKLLDEAGIPRSIAKLRPEDYWKIKAVGDTLPAVSVPHNDHRDGPPEEGEDVMNSYSPDQIMIAGRDKNGDRTGMQRTLSEYAAKKLRLPDDAAKVLDVEPNVYSQAKEKTADLYENRSRDQTTSRAGW
jgi:hypothetical protein